MKTKSNEATRLCEKKKFDDAAEDRFGEEEGQYENDDQGGSREPRGASQPDADESMGLGDGKSRAPDYDSEPPAKSAAARDFTDQKRGKRSRST